MSPQNWGNFEFSGAPATQQTGLAHNRDDYYYPAFLFRPQCLSSSPFKCDLVSIVCVLVTSRLHCTRRCLEHKRWGADLTETWTQQSPTDKNPLLKFRLKQNFSEFSVSHTSTTSVITVTKLKCSKKVHRKAPFLILHLFKSHKRENEMQFLAPGRINSDVWFSPNLLAALQLAFDKILI